MGRRFPFFFILAASLSAQTLHTVTANLTVLARSAARKPQPSTAPRPARTEGKPRRAAPASIPGHGSTQTGNGAATLAGFGALLDEYASNPPDCGGAVGPSDVVTMLNTQVLIQSRAGDPRPAFPMPLSQFWSPLGAFTKVFDPRVLYDATAGRWLASAAANPTSAESALLIAVSRTSDPAGDWTMSLVPVGNSGVWADYPQLGFNATWVVVTANLLELPPNGRYSASAVYAFDRAALYAGTPSFTTFQQDEGALVPATDLDGSYPGTLYFARASTSGETGEVLIAALRGSRAAPEFQSAAASVPLGEGWADAAPAGDDFAPQRGTYFKIDAGDSRLQNCVVRNAALWCAQTVFLPAAKPNRSAVQWFQIDPAAASLQQSGRIDDAQAAEFYAFPSIAVNRFNDVVVGFARFSGGAYPSAGFAYRLATDSNGTMRPVQTLKAGEAAYVAPGADEGANRWGDFTVTVVDPAGDLGFWTIQQYAAVPTNHYLGRWGTWWSRITLEPSAPAAAPTVR
ncbi:MAG TPA: hypothetical protein VN736_12260 [Candidatus Limnocylindrales bacterium]|nr:hypothetical protein [Candidatus Limnocylindrales bacterium]